MNSIDIGLAFVEGLALIVSPCILPVLPLVLATSIDGKRARPFGVIAGFVLSFTAFALASRALVNALGIDLDIIKYVSLVLLAAFGIVLLSSTLSEKFSVLTQRFANTGGALSANGTGFFGGLLAGFLIGLVWTPCAGPILAAVLVQVIRQQDSLQALPVLIAFAVGAGLPMLFIALFGRALTKKLGFFSRHAAAVRRFFGVLILAAVAFLATGIDPQSFFQSPPSATENERVEAAPESLKNALPQPYAAPEFKGIETWLNSKPLTLKELKGKVVLVDFWTYSCINCVRTFPYITRWDSQYRDKGLVIVGMHAPEFEFEKKIDNVKAAIEKFGINYPVAIDNNLDTWTAFENQYWPAHYLIDREGKVVYTHFGEGEYAQTENNIRFLLGLKASADMPKEETVYRDGQTPETYLGSARADTFMSPEARENSAASYSLPEELPMNGWALKGKWSIEPERIVAQEDGAALQLNFTARKVFLVLGTKTGKPLRVTLKLNGAPLGTNAGRDVSQDGLVVGQHTLYELVDQKEFKSGMLDITSDEPGLEAYAFTFGG